MKILIVGPRWIGDAVMSIPAMRTIREGLPKSRITLYSGDLAHSLFEEADFLDELMITRADPGSKFRLLLEESKRLRTTSFDAAVLFPNSFRSALTVAFARIPRRFGYRTDGRGILLTDPVQVPEWKALRHESEFYANLASQVVTELHGSTDFVLKSTSLSVSAADRTRSGKIFEKYNIDPGRPLLALGAGSTNSIAKRWPAAYFSELCDIFADQMNPQIILLGSASERDIADQIRRITKADVTDLTGQTDLSLATAILAEADLFISNDMGLAHVSGAVGTPTLTIFGPTNEIATAPLGPNARVIRESVECSPCMLRKCPIDHRCMLRLTPNMVFETAVQMLRNRIT